MKNALWLDDLGVLRVSLVMEANPKKKKKSHKMADAFTSPFLGGRLAAAGHSGAVGLWTHFTKKRKQKGPNENSDIRESSLSLSLSLSVRVRLAHPCLSMKTVECGGRE